MNQLESLILTVSYVARDVVVSRRKESLIISDKMYEETNQTKKRGKMVGEGE